LHLAQFDLNTVARRGGDFPVFREQAQRRVLLMSFVKDLQRLAPDRFLTIVNLPQIQHRPLHRVVLSHAAFLHHAEIAMLFAIFLSDFSAKKHRPRHHARTPTPLKRG
jgi:hypothetical protein